MGSFTQKSWSRESFNKSQNHKQGMSAIQIIIRISPSDTTSLRLLPKYVDTKKLTAARNKQNP